MNTTGFPRPRRPFFLFRAMVIATILVTSLLFPVSQGVTASAPATDTGGPGSGLSNEATAFRLFNDVFSGKNAAACPELVAESARIYTPDGVYAGHEGMNSFVDGLRASFPDARFRVTDLVTDGDTVVASWVMTGTQDGAFQDIAATGASVSLNGVTILRFEGSMIAEEWVAYDRLHLVQQIEAGSDPPNVCPPCSGPW
ncbi:MAG TPA: ester cyclase [Thermomicrobiales bacterium]|nr:ester cyclase [Thermomicrobiales bacterium]